MKTLRTSAVAILGLFSSAALAEPPLAVSRVLAEFHVEFQKAPSPEALASLQSMCRSNVELILFRERDELVRKAISLLGDSKVEEAEAVFKRIDDRAKADKIFAEQECTAPPADTQRLAANDPHHDVPQSNTSPRPPEKPAGSPLNGADAPLAPEAKTSDASAARTEATTRTSPPASAAYAPSTAAATGSSLTPGLSTGVVDARSSPATRPLNDATRPITPGNLRSNVVALIESLAKIGQSAVHASKTDAAASRHEEKSPKTNSIASSATLGSSPPSGESLPNLTMGPPLGEANEPKTSEVATPHSEASPAQPLEKIGQSTSQETRAGAPASTLEGSSPGAGSVEPTTANQTISPDQHSLATSSKNSPTAPNIEASAQSYEKTDRSPLQESQADISPALDGASAAPHDRRGTAAADTNSPTAASKTGTQNTEAPAPSLEKTGQSTSQQSRADVPAPTVERPSPNAISVASITDKETAQHDRPALAASEANSPATPKIETSNIASSARSLEKTDQSTPLQPRADVPTLTVERSPPNAISVASETDSATAPHDRPASVNQANSPATQKIETPNTASSAQSLARTDQSPPQEAQADAPGPTLEGTSPKAPSSTPHDGLVSAAGDPKVDTPYIQAPAQWSEKIRQAPIQESPADAAPSASQEAASNASAVSGANSQTPSMVERPNIEALLQSLQNSDQPTAQKSQPDATASTSERSPNEISIASTNSLPAPAISAPPSDLPKAPEIETLNAEASAHPLPPPSAAPTTDGASASAALGMSETAGQSGFESDRPTVSTAISASTSPVTQSLNGAHAPATSDSEKAIDASVPMWEKAEQSEPSPADLIAPTQERKLAYAAPEASSQNDRPSAAPAMAGAEQPTPSAIPSAAGSWEMSIAAIEETDRERSRIDTNLPTKFDKKPIEELSTGSLAKTKSTFRGTLPLAMGGSAFAASPVKKQRPRSVVASVGAPEEQPPASGRFNDATDGSSATPSEMRTPDHRKASRASHTYRRGYPNDAAKAATMDDRRKNKSVDRPSLESTPASQATVREETSLHQAVKRRCPSILERADEYDEELVALCRDSAKLE
jgi:hypothetical protein